MWLHTEHKLKKNKRHAAAVTLTLSKEAGWFSDSQQVFVCDCECDVCVFRLQAVVHGEGYRERETFSDWVSIYSLP